MAKNVLQWCIVWELVPLNAGPACGGRKMQEKQQDACVLRFFGCFYSRKKYSVSAARYLLFSFFAIVFRRISRSRIAFERAAAVDGVTLGAPELVADATWLLNESLQYRLYVDVECVVRRLAQRTAVEAL